MKLVAEFTWNYIFFSRVFEPDRSGQIEIENGNVENMTSKKTMSYLTLPDQGFGLKWAKGGERWMRELLGVREKPVQMKGIPSEFPNGKSKIQSSHNIQNAKFVLSK